MFTRPSWLEPALRSSSSFVSHSAKQTPSTPNIATFCFQSTDAVNRIRVQCLKPHQLKIELFRKMLWRCITSLVRIFLTFSRPYLILTSYFEFVTVLMAKCCHTSASFDGLFAWDHCDYVNWWRSGNLRVFRVLSRARGWRSPGCLTYTLALGWNVAALKSPLVIASREARTIKASRSLYLTSHHPERIHIIYCVEKLWNLITTIWF